MDKDENRQNAYTPSPSISLSEQLLYKIASLDTAVQQGFRRLDERMDRIQTDFHDAQLSVNDRISKLDKETAEAFAAKRLRIDTLVQDRDMWREKQNERFQKIETWQAVAMAKVGVIMGLITSLATMFAPTVRHALGIPG